MRIKNGMVCQVSAEKFDDPKWEKAVIKRTDDGQSRWRLVSQSKFGWTAKRNWNNESTSHFFVWRLMWAIEFERTSESMLTILMNRWRNEQQKRSQKRPLRSENNETTRQQMSPTRHNTTRDPSQGDRKHSLIGKMCQHQKRKQKMMDYRKGRWKCVRRDKLFEMAAVIFVASAHRYKPDLPPVHLKPFCIRLKLMWPKTNKQTICFFPFKIR